MRAPAEMKNLRLGILDFGLGDWKRMPLAIHNRESKIQNPSAAPLLNHSTGRFRKSRQISIALTAQTIPGASRMNHEPLSATARSVHSNARNVKITSINHAGQSERVGGEWGIRRFWIFDLGFGLSRIRALASP